MANDDIDVSIIIPAYNEAAIIGQTLESVAAYLNDHPEFGKTEVIIVAAGSDDTVQIARAYEGRFLSLRFVTPPKALGKGSDVHAGFQAATGRYQLFTDADLSTPLHHIGPMIAMLEEGSDVVIGRRNLAAIHHHWLRALVSVLSNYLVRFLLLPGIHDSQCGFKGFRAPAAKELFGDTRHINGWAFDIEILTAARQRHFRIKEQAISDWKETRDDDLRSESLAGVLVRTFGELLSLRASLWLGSLAKRSSYLIAVGAFLSFGMMLVIGMGQSVWYDEAYSIMLAHLPVRQLVHLTSVDVHPPLYYLLLKGWSRLFGFSDVSLRALSAMFGAGAVWMGLILVRRLWNARIVIAALPFAVLAPFIIRYGFEIRMYAAASFICMAATYILLRALQAKSNHSRIVAWVLYALLVTAGMYLLYYTVLVWVAQALWCVHYTWARRKIRSWRVLFQPWLFAYGAAALLFLPWLPIFFRQLHAVQDSFWIGPSTYERIVSVASFSLNYLPTWSLNPWRSLEWMAAFVAAVTFVTTTYIASKGRERSYLLLLILITVVPIIILYCASLPPRQPVFVERYVSQSILATYILLGVAVALSLRKRVTVLKLLAAFGLVIVLGQGVLTLAHTGNFNFDQLSRPTARQVSGYLASHNQAGWPIVTDGPYSYIELTHYLPNQPLLFYSPNPVGTSGGYAVLHDSDRRIGLLRTFTGTPVWIVYGGAKPRYVPANHIRSSGVSFGRYHADLYSYAPAHEAR